MEENKPLKLTFKKTPLKLSLKKPEEHGTETPLATAQEMTLPAGAGIQIILKNAKIHAEKVIIKKIEKK
jgi:CO dehydrogenase/acetyl-CoA synthase beta subunit